MPRALLGLLVAAAGAHCAPHAHAENAVPLELTWDAAEGCPSKDAVLARLRQIVGAAPAPSAPLRAEARITAQPTGAFQLRLTTHSGNLVGVRNVSGKSCKDLAAVTAFWLAILLNSAEPLSKRSAEPSPAPSAPDASRAEGAGAVVGALKTEPEALGEQSAVDAGAARVRKPEKDRVLPDSKDSAPPRRVHALLRLPLGALGVGPLPGVSYGFGVGAGVSYDSWRFLAEGELWLSQHATARQLLDEYTVQLKRVSVGLRACRKLWGTRFEVAPCAIVSAQHLSAQGAGPNLASETPHATWLSLGFGVQTRVLVAPPVRFVLGVDAELQTARPLVELGGVGTVERLSPAAVTAIVGVEWIL